MGTPHREMFPIQKHHEFSLCSTSPIQIIMYNQIHNPNFGVLRGVDAGVPGSFWPGVTILDLWHKNKNKKRHKYTNATKHKQAIKKLTKNEILSVVVMMWKWHCLRKHELDHSRAALEETRTWLNYSHMPVFNQTMHGHVVWKADHLLCIFITVWPPSTHSERNSKLLNVSIAENNPGEFNFLNPLYTGQSCRTCSAVCFGHTRIATKQIDKYSSDYSVSCALSCDE